MKRLDWSLRPGRTNTGICCMGKSERERIRSIRFYQLLGFQLKEIRVLLEAPVPVRKAALQRKEEELESEYIRLQELIRQVKEFIAAL